MNRFEMFDAMIHGKTVDIVKANQTFQGKIMGIALEDGSGNNFIVTLHELVTHKTHKIFVRSK